MIVVPEATSQKQQTSVTVQTEETPVKKTPKRVKKLPNSEDEKED
jgi:hypothetical protein